MSLDRLRQDINSVAEDYGLDLQTLIIPSQHLSFTTDLRAEVCTKDEIINTLKARGLEDNLDLQLEIDELTEDRYLVVW